MGQSSPLRQGEEIETKEKQEASPRIAVLIPTYNRADFIGQAIQSIFRQTCQRFDVILYDDGSTDGTPNIFPQFRDWRFLAVRGVDHRGVVYARNHLLEIASNYEYAAWQDSDDLSNIHRLEIELAAIHKTGAAQVCSRWRDFTDTAPDITERPQERKKNPKWGAFASTLFRPQLAPRFKESTPGRREDTPWVEEFERTAGKRVVLAQELYYWRRHPGQSCPKERYASSARCL